MNESKLREYIRNFIKEILDEDEELEEVTTTGDVDGYNTPFSFGSNSKKSKKKKKRIATNSTGYKTVNEEIDDKDIKIIKQLIRDVVADVYRDIWLKRSTWTKA